MEMSIWSRSGTTRRIVIQMMMRVSSLNTVWAEARAVSGFDKRVGASRESCVLQECSLTSRFCSLTVRQVTPDS